MVESHYLDYNDILSNFKSNYINKIGLADIGKLCVSKCRWLFYHSDFEVLLYEDRDHSSQMLDDRLREDYNKLFTSCISSYSRNIKLQSIGV